MKKEIYRNELYKDVWKRPSTHIASSYGISDVALSKICRKLNVPKPPRGYWAKLRGGYGVKRIPLPHLPPGAPDKHVLKGEMVREKELSPSVSNAVQEQTIVDRDETPAQPFFRKIQKPLYTSPAGEIYFHPVKATDPHLTSDSAEYNPRMRFTECDFSDVKEIIDRQAKKALRFAERRSSSKSSVEIANHVSLPYEYVRDEDGDESREIDLYLSVPTEKVLKNGIIAKVAVFNAKGNKIIGRPKITNGLIKIAFRIVWYGDHRGVGVSILVYSIQLLETTGDFLSKSEQECIKELNQQVQSWTKYRWLREYIRAVMEKASKRKPDKVFEERLNEWVDWANSYADWLNPLADKFPFED